MLETRALISLCLVVAPGASNLAISVDALKAQTLEAFKVHIVVEASDTANLSAAKAVAEADKRFAVLETTGAKPWPARANAVLRKVPSEYAAVLHSGDHVAPKYFEMLIDALKETPEAVLSYCGAALPWRPGVGPGMRMLDMIASAESAVTSRGVFKTSILIKSGVLPEDQDYNAALVFQAQLARFGTLIGGDAGLCRPSALPIPTFLDEDSRFEAWAEHCAALVAQGLRADGSPQELRQLWMAGITRLVSPGLSEPLLGRKAFTEAEQTTLVQTFLDAFDAMPDLNVPYILDQDWERIRHWTKAFLWSPPTSLDLLEFGPQPVNAGEVFNPGVGGTATLWVKTRGRIPAGTRIRLAGRDLDTAIAENRAMAPVPADLTAEAGELPLLLVSVDGKALTKADHFWVMRKTALGRGLSSFLRRLRGKPEPGSRIAISGPK